VASHGGENCLRRISGATDVANLATGVVFIESKVDPKKYVADLAADCQRKKDRVRPHAGLAYFNFVVEYLTQEIPVNNVKTIIFSYQSLIYHPPKNLLVW
jgi:hypothetical protein